MPQHSGADLLHGYVRDLVQQIAPNPLWVTAGTIQTDHSLLVDGLPLAYPADGSELAYYYLQPCGLNLAATSATAPGAPVLQTENGGASGTDNDVHFHYYYLPGVLRPPQPGDRVAVILLRSADEGDPDIPFVLGVLVRAGTVAGASL